MIRKLRWKVVGVTMLFVTAVLLAVFAKNRAFAAG